MTKTWLPPVLGVALAAFVASPTMADDFDSVFISNDRNNCVSPTSNDFEAEFYCLGRNDIPNYIAFADAKRQAFIGKANNAKLERANDDTLPDVTAINPDVEWRISDGSGNWQAFASIQKWFTVNEWGTKGETLVITKVEKGSTCHIAYIDAVVTPRPYTRARKIADLCTPKFRCDGDKPMVVSGPLDEENPRICTHTWSGLVWPQ